MRLDQDSRFFVQRVDYSGHVAGATASDPPLTPGQLNKLDRNELSFDQNYPFVLVKLGKAISTFKRAFGVAAVQADVVAHSMGGDLARATALSADFDVGTYDSGPIHKLITIGTPHLGTPLATLLLRPENDCVRGEIAEHGGKLAFFTVVVGSSSLGGAVRDLQGDLPGDNPGDHLSVALADLPVSRSYPIAYIAGTMAADNLSGLTSGFAAVHIRQNCDREADQPNPLAQNLTAQGWPTVFGQNSDAIVPLSSQENGTAGVRFLGVIHSHGASDLSFNGPNELEQASGIPDKVIDLLNEKTSGTDFQN